MDLNKSAENFRDWTPISLYWENGAAFVDWCYLGAARFVEPFFDMTIDRRLREPFNVLFRRQTPLEILGELFDREAQTITPTGFIFHLSRCGSTLVSQMLAASRQNIVISEALPITRILQAGNVAPQIDEAQRINWLHWIIKAFAQKRSAPERNFFIKFDSWNTLDLDLIERAFPGVPWIFIYRNPLEVIVSQRQKRSAQMIPGASTCFLPGMTLLDAFQMPPEEYCARVLAAFCEKALAHCDHPNARLINYDQLPEAVTTEILEHFRVEYAPADLETMKSVAKFDAKAPQTNFVPDAERKNREASAAEQAAAEKWVDPLYERLENARRQNGLQ